MRSLFAASAVALIMAVSACSPAGEKAAEAPKTDVAEAPAPAPAAPPATEAPAAPTATTVALEITDAAGAKMTGDTARGQRVFAQCMTCHSKDEGVNRTGPSLYGIIGRKAGTIPGFRYSDANKNSGITWTEQEMFTYLENPKAKIPGTIMAFVGLRNPQQRADVIAYLKTDAAN
jgi:cytochrome c